MIDGVARGGNGRVEPEAKRQRTDTGVSLVEQGKIGALSDDVFRKVIGLVCGSGIFALLQVNRRWNAHVTVVIKEVAGFEGPDVNSLSFPQVKRQLRVNQLGFRLKFQGNVVKSGLSALPSLLPPQITRWVKLRWLEDQVCKGDLSLWLEWAKRMMCEGDHTHVFSKLVTSSTAPGDRELCQTFLQEHIREIIEWVGCVAAVDYIRLIEDPAIRGRAAKELILVGKKGLSWADFSILVTNVLNERPLIAPHSVLLGPIQLLIVEKAVEERNFVYAIRTLPLVGSIEHNRRATWVVIEAILRRGLSPAALWKESDVPYASHDVAYLIEAYIKREIPQAQRQFSTWCFAQAQDLALEVAALGHGELAFWFAKQFAEHIGQQIIIHKVLTTLPKPGGFALCYAELERMEAEGVSRSRTASELAVEAVKLGELLMAGRFLKFSSSEMERANCAELAFEFAPFADALPFAESILVASPRREPEASDQITKAIALATAREGDMGQVEYHLSSIQNPSVWLETAKLCAQRTALRGNYRLADQLLKGPVPIRCWSELVAKMAEVSFLAGNLHRFREYNQSARNIHGIGMTLIPTGTKEQFLLLAGELEERVEREMFLKKMCDRLLDERPQAAFELSRHLPFESCLSVHKALFLKGYSQINAEELVEQAKSSVSAQIHLTDLAECLADRREFFLADKLLKLIEHSSDRERVYARFAVQKAAVGLLESGQKWAKKIENEDVRRDAYKDMLKNASFEEVIFDR
ncbi:MAG: hypothetical protein S4CHLAM102_15060 [Chlamydiia bacterium]|nr:hypothetical protein [Chlamydiia bacterium]